jgi:alkylation response protein AidB-like acyl-CoA dehydrogenase
MFDCGQWPGLGYCLEIFRKELKMTGLTEEQRILLENVRRASRQKIAPLACEIDRTGEFSWEIASALWDLGVLQIMLPESYGGWLLI